MYLALLKAKKVGSGFKGHCHSDSMFPLIWIGDQLQIVKVPSSEYQVGDIVAYMHTSGKSKKIKVHRIIAINNKSNAVVTKGDNLIVIDRPIKISSLLGKVVTITNRNRSTTDWRSKMFGFYLATAGRKSIPTFKEILFALEQQIKRWLHALIYA